MAESFDAVLAEMRQAAVDDDLLYMESAITRLQSAHEAEVAERDARIARLQKGCQTRAEDYATLTAMWVKDEAEYRARAEAAEQDARRAVGLLRDYRMAPKFSHDHAAIKRTVELEDEIDAFLSEQAGERENGK